MTRVEKDARGFLEDNMKPTHHAVRSSSSCEGLLGSNGGKNGLLCRPLQRDRDQSEGQEGMDPDMLLFFTYSIKLPSPAPFSMGNTFSG